MHRKLLWQLQIAYLETFPTFIRLLRKAKFFGYCASYNYFPTAHLRIICLLQIDKICQQWKSFNICLLCIEKLYKNIKSPIWKHIDVSYRYCAKPNFLATAHLLFSYCECPYYLSAAIEQLFQHCKSSKHMITVYRKSLWQLQIAYFEIFGRFIWLLHKAQFFCYCASPNYLCTANRQVISRLDIVFIIVYCA